MSTQPAFPLFCELAASYSVVPVWRELGCDTVTPVGAFLRLCERASGGGTGFLLESVEHGERWGRFSFVGRNPAATLTLREGRVVPAGKLPVGVPLDQGILAALEDVLSKCRTPPAQALAGSGGFPPLHAGMVGYLGYDVVREIERLGETPPDDLKVPDAVMTMIGELAAFDHLRQRVFLIVSVFTGEKLTSGELEDLYKQANHALDTLEGDLARPHPREGFLDVAVLPNSQKAAGVRRRMSRREFTEAVEVVKEHILAGDAFQVVLAQRFDLEESVDPLDAYRVLRQVNPSPYMYLFRHPNVALAGSSPEPMVKVVDGTVISRPIAGTRPRGGSEEEDRRLAAELAEHPKELAEHVMLVDLARNDVGRVARFGTEKVDELMTLERYSHVMHMTSQVSARLREGCGPVDVIRATLPAGTVSGAPKVSAMKIIDRLEASKRGPYAGVVGYLDFSGNLDTAIAIRTLVVDGQGRASVQAGAGIVADSNPEAEDDECQFKAAAVLSAARAAAALSQARAAKQTVG